MPHIVNRQAFHDYRRNLKLVRERRARGDMRSASLRLRLAAYYYRHACDLPFYLLSVRQMRTGNRKLAHARTYRHD